MLSWAGRLLCWCRPTTCPSSCRTQTAWRCSAMFCFFYPVSHWVVFGVWGSLIASHQQLRGQLSCQKGLHVLSWELIAWLNLPLK